MRLLLLILLLSPTFLLSQKHEIWKHVYSSNRLQILQDSITVTGVIHKTIACVDGDIHYQLKVDNAYLPLLNKGNNTKQNSCLVVELICINESPINKCNGYINNVIVPKDGDIVEIYGTFVYDRRHGWNEIHPVYKIILKGNIYCFR